ARDVVQGHRGLLQRLACARVNDLGRDLAQVVVGEARDPDQDRGRGGGGDERGDREQEEIRVLLDIGRERLRRRLHQQGREINLVREGNHPPIPVLLRQDAQPPVGGEHLHRSVCHVIYPRVAVKWNVGRRGLTPPTSPRCCDRFCSVGPVPEAFGEEPSPTQVTFRQSVPTRWTTRLSGDA